MKIENPAIKNALNQTAKLLDVSPSDLLDLFLSNFAEEMEKNPVQELPDLAQSFEYKSKDQAQAVADRLNAVFAHENLEGRTPLEYTCAVVEREEHFGLEVTLHHEEFGPVAG